MKKELICTACLTEATSLVRPCDKCGSRKFISTFWLRDRLGEHWRALLESEKQAVN